MLFCNDLSCEELLRDAAKAQIRRMCTRKKTRKDLNVPEWVIAEYKSRPQNETATLLMNCNFDKAGYPIDVIFACIYCHANSNVCLCQLSFPMHARAGEVYRFFGDCGQAPVIPQGDH